MTNNRQKNEDRIKKLELETIIGRTIVNCESDIDPLIKYLDMALPDDWHNMEPSDKAKKIAHYFREMGSNDIATFIRGEPVEYDEIVYDVGKKIKAEVSQNKSAFENEEKIIKKIFADTLDKMSDEEKKELFKNMGVTSEDIQWNMPGMTLTTQVLLKKFGGFGIYKISLIVANAIARQILGRGLSLATNAMIARGISVFTGPIGWILTGIWLLIDIAGPAYKKTMPSVIYIAALRLMLLYRINIGVVGDGSTGKDAMIKSVFNIDTGNISPIAGSTFTKEIYDLGSGAYLTNFPGFNDYRPEVDKELDDYIRHMDAFILLVDITRGVTKTDIKIFENIKSFGKPTLVCLNKIDIARPEKVNELIMAAKMRISAEIIYETAFDPDTRVWKDGPINCEKVYKWVCQQIERDGKDSSSIPKGEF